jgi:hypothetical protein
MSKGEFIVLIVALFHLSTFSLIGLGSQTVLFTSRMPQMKLTHGTKAFWRNCKLLNSQEFTNIL